MQILVNKNYVEFDANTKVNKNEFKATPLRFIFTPDYDGLTCKAVFSKIAIGSEEVSFYQEPIIDGSCYIPNEVMGYDGVLIGVYGYDAKGDELIIRYSPAPKKLWFLEGSYYDGAASPEEINPSQFEQYITYLNKEVEKLNKIKVETKNINNGVQISVTNSDGITQITNIYNGEEGPAGPQGETGEAGPAGRDGVIQYTAGSNITISEENVISATDTTYTAGDNITISGGVINCTAAVNPEVITSLASTYTISSLGENTVYKLGEITALTITEVTTFDRESIIYFTSGSTATSVSVPEGLVNIGDFPEFTANDGVNEGTCEEDKSYIISILNNIAVWKAY